MTECKIEGGHQIVAVPKRQAGLKGRDAEFAAVAPGERMQVSAGTAFALDPWPADTQTVAIVEAETDLVVTGPAAVLPLSGTNPVLTQARRTHRKVAGATSLFFGVMVGLIAWVAEIDFRDPLHLGVLGIGVALWAICTVAAMSDVPKQKELLLRTEFGTQGGTYRSYARPRPRTAETYAPYLPGVKRYHDTP